MSVDIFVLSKGRHPLPKRVKLLAEAQIPFYLVVEPQEFDLYQQTVAMTKVKLPQSKQGIAYVRNYILNNAKSEWAWVLDDDISNLGLVEGKKCVPYSPATVLATALTVFKKFKKPINGLAYDQYAWSSPMVTENRFCEVAV